MKKKNNFNIEKYIKELENLDEKDILRTLISYEPEYDLYYKIDKKLKKFDKVLVIVIDYKQKEKYNPNLLKQSQKTLVEAFDLKEKAVIIFDLNKLPLEIVTNIRQTPVFYIFENKNYNIIFSAQGYVLKQNK